MVTGILARIAAGQPEAMAECLNQYGDAVWSLARRRFSRRVDCEDAVQEVFTEVWRSAGRYEPSLSSELTFILIIARRRMIDKQRRLVHSVSPSGDEQLDSCSGDVSSGSPDITKRDDIVEIKEEAGRARRLMSDLRPEERRVLELAIDDGWSQSSIAKHLDLPLGTVKSHARRALTRLREWMTADATRVSGGGR